MPAQPIDKGRPGPGLMAQVVSAKYSDHLPLNCQVEIFARHGVEVAARRWATGSDRSQHERPPAAVAQSMGLVKLT